MTSTIPQAAQQSCDDAKRNISRGGAMGLATALICLDAARQLIHEMIEATGRPVDVPDSALDEVGQLMAERDARLCIR